MANNFINSPIIKSLTNNQHTWLITGVAGFVGSNLLERLLQLNQKVIGLDNFSTGSSENLNDIKNDLDKEQWKNFSLQEGDLSNYNDCQKACKNVNFVLHQGALGSVPRSIENPILTNSSNINGFLNILLASKEAKVESFTYAASSSTYGDHPALPKEESIIGNPLSPYAVTKYVNELYADVFKKCYDFNSIGLRYFNVFGKRQRPDGPYAAVIPRWIDAMLQGNKIYINGDGETSRDFCYIENVIQANLLAAACKRKEGNNQVYNVAVGERNSLIDLFYILKDALIANKRHYNLEPIYRDFRSGDVRHSQADISKIKDFLGYNPEYNLLQGIKEVMPWFVSKSNQYVK